MTTFIVKVRGEFTQTLGVVAETEAAARAKAEKSLGEQINLQPVGPVEVVEIKGLAKSRGASAACSIRCSRSVS